MIIKSDVEHHREPRFKDLRTLESYTRVTTNKRYLRQLQRIIEEVNQNEIQKETSCR